MLPRFLRIPIFNAGQKIVKDDNTPTTEFITALNNMRASIESSVNSVKKQADDIALSLQRAGIALTTSEDIKAELEAERKKSALRDSFVEPNQILSATVSADDPAKATITIAAHQRRYADGRAVEVEAGTVYGVSAGALLFIYYDDPARAGGAVDYRSTDNSTMAVQAGDRHLVGMIQTPGAGAAPATGGGTTGPGVPYRGGGYTYDRLEVEQ